MLKKEEYFYITPQEPLRSGQSLALSQTGKALAHLFAESYHSIAN